MNQSKNRSSNYYKQVRWSFFLKILAVGCNLISIPFMFRYLGKEEYGIWSTLLSIVSWIILFDVGIGNGIRNKITESLTTQETERTKGYISTGYVIIGVIIGVLLLILFPISYLISWQKVFNTSILPEDSLRNIVNITLVFVLLNFWLNLIDQVFNGIQRTSLTILNQFLKNLTILIFVLLLYYFTESSLLNLAIAYGSATVLINVGLSFWFYRKNKLYQPNISTYSRIYVKSITKLGINFFIVQIAVVVLFTTDRLLITQLFGSERVADYDVVFRLFSIITMVHTILMAPLWSAYSDAFHRRDFLWMDQALRKQLKIFILFVFGIIFLGLFTRPIIKMWIGNEVEVDVPLVLAMALFVTVSVWNNIFACFMNATNQLKTQIITSAFAIFINIPLSILLVKQFNMGVYAVVLSTILALSLFAFFGARQVFKILKDGKQKG